MLDELHEECGVFGIYGTDDAAAHTALGLHALQHRGQEAAGIISERGGHFSSHKAMGHVGDNFNSQAVINKLPGGNAIGHVRYSTAGGKHDRNIQPIFAEFSFGGMAIAHNGNLTNVEKLKKELIRKGAIFQSSMDTELFIHLIAQSEFEKVQDRVVDALKQIEGAYSFVALTRKKLIAGRDPLGIRPLVYGKLGDAHVFASESCAFDIIGAEFVRDVEPGELIIIDQDGFHSTYPFEKTSSKFCIFEYVYFSRPDSFFKGHQVYDVRKNIGRELAKESAIADIDVVVPVPDSGVPAALGFAEQAKLPFELGIIRNHYVGRTFIEPTDQVRNLGVKLKHNANTAVLKGKNVVLVDDSIVRGTTSKKIVNMVREAGAKEVHMCIASPPTTDPCFYGVDTPEKDKLMASNHSIRQMAKIIGVDGLHFLSIDGLYRAVYESKRNNINPQYCDACFTGEYPIAVKPHDNTNDSNTTFTETVKAG